MREIYIAVIIISVIGIYLTWSYLTNNSKSNDKDYDIEEIPNFLTDEECNNIIKTSIGNLSPSRVYSDNDDVLSTSMRKSNQCWLDDSYDCAKIISERVKDYTKTHNNNQEQLQVVQYNKGGFFNPHYDACEGTSEYCKRMDGNQGPRLYTVLIYLNDDFEGGETVFPKINKVVKPEKGKAVLFRNVDDNGVIIKESFHGGVPVKEGEKWIANKWVRIN